MMAGAVQRLILEELRKKGPMTVAELADELGMAPRELTGPIKSLHIRGRVYIVGKRSKYGNKWAFVYPQRGSNN